MNDSPFEPTLGHLEAALPSVFREQLFGGDVVLDGAMEIVWHRPRWIRPLLVLLARYDMLFPETGRNVAASLAISRQEDGHVWRRSFAFPIPRRFDALLVYDSRAGFVTERMRSLAMRWTVTFLPPQALKIRSVGGGLVFGRSWFPLPRLLLPDVEAIEVAVAPDALTVCLTASHPLLGRFFGYAGSFRLRKDPLGVA